MRVNSRELARLAENVYDEGGAPDGWSRESSRNGSDGFSGAVYQRRSDGLRCLTLRGSDDWMDWVFANPQMLPASVRDELVAHLESPRNLAVSPLGLLQGHILSRFTGRLPQSQSRQALDMFNANREVSQSRSACTPASRPIEVVTGHSLGGALAASVGQQTGTATITFNAPKIGLLAGAVPMTSSGIAHVNSHKDIVSTATRAAGSLPVGEVITVSVAPWSPGRSVGTQVARRLAAILPTTASAMSLADFIGQLKHYHSMGPLIQAGAGDKTVSLR
jgi:hypothetical protein